MLFIVPFILVQSLILCILFLFRMQAQKALGRSGRVFGGTLMVGVLPCSDPTGVNGADSSHLETSVFGGLTSVPPYSSEQQACDTLTVHTLNSSLNTTKSIRSLTQSYKAAQNDLDVSIPPYSWSLQT